MTDSEQMKTAAEDWQHYIGSVWAGFLRSHNLHKNAVVIEVGAGFAHKVGLGLAQTGFSGKLYILEPAEQALEFTFLHYKKILPNARIIAVNQTLASWDVNVPEYVDALLMNHVLDDFILHAAASQQLGKVIFDNMRSNQVVCQEEVSALWSGIMNNTAWRNQLTATVLESLIRFIGRTRPALLGISQYESWFLNRNGLRAVNQYCSKVLAMLAWQLGNTVSEDQQMLQAHGQKAEEWLLLDLTTQKAGGENSE